MPRLVRDDGRRNARLVLISEAPGEHEDARGVPFVGPAGYKLSEWWRESMLSRPDFYITNVYPYRPAKNDIRSVPWPELQQWIGELHKRLSVLDDPWLIVPTGNTALKALTGLSYISRRRGSIYAYRDQRGRYIKVIPTIHPAAIFRQSSWERRCRYDWHRIASDSMFRDLRVPQREHFIRPTLNDLYAYLADARSRAEVLALDIETPRELTLVPRQLKSGKTTYRKVKGARRITCVGFAFESNFSITIPTTLQYWHDEATLAEVWQIIRELCALETSEKATQNGLFDAFWLATYGVRLARWRWDTRWMSHAQDPLDAHSLDYQASIHTREPYWKDDTKEKNEDAPGDKYSDIETFWRYNGKDAAVTRELVDVHHERLGKSRRLGYYERQYVAMFEPLLEMSLGGMRFDDPHARRTRAKFMAECIAIQDKLTVQAGGELYGPKGSLSFKRLQDFLYSKLGLPPQRNRATGRMTTNEIAVRTLMLRYPDKLGRDGEADRPGPLILAHRRKEALLRFTKDTIADSDSYARSQFGWVDTMRLRSGKNPRGGGNNSQNTDRELLHLYLADPGHVLIEADLSQAEDRVVKMLTRSPRLIERARMKPWENDEHIIAASLIFGVPQDQVTRKPNGGQRYLGKRARHAGNYGMHGRTLSDQLLKEGTVITPDEGDRMINTILDRDTPEVRDWQRETRQYVLRYKMLANSWGLVWDLTYERVNDELFRSAYALIPQSEVVMLVNNWGFVPLFNWLRESGIPARIVNQRHDSLVISTPPQYAWAIACFLKASLERPRIYAGNELTIPVEFKVGKNAAMQHEFKRFPTKREFEQVVWSLADAEEKQAA